MALEFLENHSDQGIIEYLKSFLAEKNSICKIAKANIGKELHSE